VGTLIDITKKIVLVTEPEKENESILRLARVGYENVVGYLNGGIDSWTGKSETVKSISAAEMKSEMEKNIDVLDVRKPGEWAVSHLKNATFLPLADFPSVLNGLDKSKPYIVHCGGGYRSMTAISIMKNHGFNNLINVYGGFGAMVQAGLPIVTEEVPV
jgi:rhodanese-related sulfurtransferase